MLKDNTRLESLFDCKTNRATDTHKHTDLPVQTSTKQGQKVGRAK